MEYITDEDLLNLIIPNNRYLFRKEKLLSDDFKQKLYIRFPFAKTIKEIVACIKNNITIMPVCPTCGTPLNFTGNPNKPYNHHCSTKCSSNDSCIKEKNKKTCLEKYGVEYIGQSVQQKLKTVETCIKKYGTSYAFQSTDIKDKIKQTCLEKYGVTNGGASKEAIIKSKETKLRNALSDSNYYQNIQNKRKQTNLITYGTETYNNKEQIIKTQNSKTIHYWENVQLKRKQTCLNKYGDETYNNKEQIIKTQRNKSIQDWKNRYDKSKQTCLEKYGVDNYAKTNMFLIKQNITKHLNNSFGISQQEEESYNILKEKYSDIIRQYRDERYPFACDFYIPSKDLFIECNFHWTHGGKPFEGTDEDLQKVQDWCDKNTEYYDNAIDTWCIRDVKKRKIAKENSLNYFELWNLSELFY